MRISARCDYACKAILELSLHWPDKEPMQIHTISEKQGIPVRYLVQILIQLKSMGLVTSIRGKDGGYNLAKAPNRIKLGEVLRQMGGPLLPVAKAAQAEESEFSTIWNEVEAAMAKVLDKVTFEDVLKKVSGTEKVILYEI